LELSNTIFKIFKKELLGTRGGVCPLRFGSYFRLTKYHIFLDGRLEKRQILN
jgi:hypothetical protein